MALPLVVPPGFEPGQAEPKSDVLPLHHDNLSSLQFTVYSLRFTVYCLRFTVYGLQFTVYGLQFTVYSLQFTVYGLQFTVYSLRFTVYSGLEEVGQGDLEGTGLAFGQEGGGVCHQVELANLGTLAHCQVIGDAHLEGLFDDGTDAKVPAEGGRFLAPATLHGMTGGTAYARDDE